jgi:hypothetical protein
MPGITHKDSLNINLAYESIALFDHNNVTHKRSKLTLSMDLFDFHLIKKKIKRKMKELAPYKEHRKKENEANTFLKVSLTNYKLIP